MVKSKIVKRVILSLVCVVIFVWGISTGKLPLALGIIIGLLISLINFHLIVRATIRGLEFDTRKKMRRYYFLTNLLKYSIVVLVVYLIVLTKEVSLIGVILGLLIGVLFILARVY